MLEDIVERAAVMIYTDKNRGYSGLKRGYKHKSVNQQCWTVCKIYGVYGTYQRH